MVNDILIGCDPEFAVRSYGRSMCAYSVFGDSMWEDKTNVNVYFNYVGVDGCDDTGEIRPTPGDTPEDLTKHIKICIALAKLACDRAITIHAGAHIDRKPLGGHVHFGGTLSATLFKTVLEDLLDYTLGVFGRLIMGAEQTRRRLCHYGHFGDKRYKTWGVEWRNPPSWIISEEFALGFSELLFLIYNDIFKEKTNYGVLRDFIYGAPEKGVIEDWTDGDYNALRKFAGRGLDLINAIYGNKLKYGQVVLDMVANRAVWDSDTCLFDSWHVGNIREAFPELLKGIVDRPTQEDILIGYLDKKLEEYTSTTCALCEAPINTMINAYLRTCVSCHISLCPSCWENNFRIRRYACPCCVSGGFP